MILNDFLLLFFLFRIVLKKQVHVRRLYTHFDKAIRLPRFSRLHKVEEAEKKGPDPVTTSLPRSEPLLHEGSHENSECRRDRNRSYDACFVGLYAFPKRRKLRCLAVGCAAER